jgi:hypothetical protein
LARLGGLSGGLVDEVVGKLVKYGFFEGSLFSECNILTSKGIQKRFVEAIKRRKNDLCLQYWLLNDINVCNNPPSTDINVDINPQRKEKEREEKKILCRVSKKKLPDIFSGDDPFAGQGVEPCQTGAVSVQAPDGEPRNDSGIATFAGRGAEPGQTGAVSVQAPDGGNPPERSKKGRLDAEFHSFLSRFNEAKGSRYKPVEKVKGQFNARLLEGFTVDDMILALQNAMKARNHIESGMRYLTPEFFTRSDKLQLYAGNAVTGNPAAGVSGAVETGPGVWVENGRKFYGDREDPKEIPMDAPGRPDRGHWFDRRKGTWEFGV